MQDVNEFRQALKFTLKWEVGDKADGGYTNDPDDPGGETKWGISKRYHPNLDIKNLTPEQACTVYAEEYWDACGCDDIPFPFNAVVFDSAVNPGIGFVKTALRDAKDVNDFLQMRKMYYYGRVNKNPPSIKYLSGWLNRLIDLRKFVEINTPAQSQP